MARLLHLIPIVHDAADMGSLATPSHASTDSGEAQARKRDAIGRFWLRVETRVRELPMLGDGPLVVYQDGLPVCGREEQIVRDTAAKGSRNFRLLVSLMQAGARVMGTEDPELLMREYELVRRASEGRVDPRSASAARRVLELRDRFIAQRIDQTLHQGGTGLLLLGALHNVEPMLPADVRVQQHLELLTAA